MNNFLDFDDFIKNPAIIIDTGSYRNRIGYEFSHENCVKVNSEPCIVVRPDYRGAYPGMNAKDCYVGDDALEKVAIFSPGKIYYHTLLRKGRIQQWRFNDVEKLWWHLTYIKMKGEPCTPEEYPLLVTYSPLDDYEKIVVVREIPIMYETFFVPFLYAANRAVLSLYRTGRKTGVVVHCGAEHTYACSIINGEVRQTIEGSRCGNDVTREFFRIFKKEELKDDYYPDTKFDLPRWRCAERLKAETSYLGSSSTNPKEKEKRWIEILKEYEQDTIFQSNPCFDTELKTIRYLQSKVTEDFYFSSKDENNNNLQKITVESIHKSTGSEKIRKELFNNIVLTGGVTKTKGFIKRFHLVLRDEEEEENIRIIATEDRDHSAWIGGCFLASTDFFKNKMMIDRDEYDDRGPRYVFDVFLERQKLMFDHFHPQCKLIMKSCYETSLSNEDEIERVQYLFELARNENQDDGMCFFQVCIFQSSDIFVPKPMLY